MEVDNGLWLDVGHCAQLAANEFSSGKSDVLNINLQKEDKLLLNQVDSSNVYGQLIQQLNLSDVDRLGLCLALMVEFDPYWIYKKPSFSNSGSTINASMGCKQHDFSSKVYIPTLQTWIFLTRKLLKKPEANTLSEILRSPLIESGVLKLNDHRFTRFCELSIEYKYKQALLSNNFNFLIEHVEAPI